MTSGLGQGSGAGGAFSRRRLLGASTAVLLTAGCGAGKESGGLSSRSAHAGSASAPGSAGESGGPDGVLGGNFNGDPRGMRFSELKALRAPWLRGFVPMTEKELGAGDAAGQAGIATLLDAHRRGLGTVLSLKFPFAGKVRLPREDDPLMKAELARVDKVLHAVMGSVDILVIGNEPFLETRDDDRLSGRLNAFYRHVAAHVVARRTERFGAHGGPRLYMGALNHVERGRGEGTNAQTDRWMDFVKETPQIDGVDIHPHVKSLAEAATYTDYVRPYLTGGKRFLATEFSLVNLWADHMADHVPASVVHRLGLEPREGGWQVWEVLKEAKEHPFPREKWVGFLAASPWYEDNKDFLTRQVNAFRKTEKLAVATYGVAQDDAMVSGITARKKPWLLNSLFDNRTVRPDDDGGPARSYAWFDSFRALQRPQDHRG